LRDKEGHRRLVYPAVEVGGEVPFWIAEQVKGPAAALFDTCAQRAKVSREVLLDAFIPLVERGHVSFDPTHWRRLC
jgi:hypothetical protein